MDFFNQKKTQRKKNIIKDDENDDDERKNKRFCMEKEIVTINFNYSLLCVHIGMHNWYD